MSQSTTNHPDERLLDLLADRALEALEPAEAAELDRLLVGAGAGFEPEALDAAAGALAVGGVAVEPVPEGVMTRLGALADAWADGALNEDQPEPTPAVAGRIDPVIAARRSDAPSAAWGWVAAAACLVLAAIAWLAQPAGAPETPVVAAGVTDAFRTDVDGAAGLVQIAWTATEDPAAADGVTGEVRWDPATQQGYMTFDGLAANDPTVEQYQLWIFDAERDAAHPVDGGVFDIPAGGGEVAIRIDPRVPINEATLFAITVEPPGGVVVSTRERLPLLAQVESG